MEVGLQNRTQLPYLWEKKHDKVCSEKNEIFALNTFEIFPISVCLRIALKLSVLMQFETERKLNCDKDFNCY